MNTDLLQQVEEALSAKTPSELREIAEQVPSVSFSWLSQVARGKYPSEPTYRRLRDVYDHLQAPAKAKSKPAAAKVATA